MHGLSIDAQKAALDEWAANHTYKIIDHYIDLGISARKPISKRPELQRLLRDVEMGRIDLIAFTKLDRWTRNIREYYKCQDVLEANNVTWTAITERYGTSTANERLLTNLVLSISQDEADRTSERIKAVFEDKRRRGLVPAGKVPLGIKLVDGHYAPSDDAPKVVELFDTYINTRSIKETARRFGLTTQGISYMLRNKTYLDTGLIDEQTFNLANNIKQTRGQRATRTNRVYIFSGLVVCPYCGRKLSSANNNGYNAYRCCRKDEALCEGYYINEKKLERYCLSQLMPSVKEYNLAIKKKKQKAPDISALKAKRDKLTDLYMENLISKEKYAEDYKALCNAIIEAESSPRPVSTEEIKTVLSAYDGLSDAGKKAFWSRVLTKIVPRPETGDFTLLYTNGNISCDILRYVHNGIN
jgi:DNA invertase Pin-like site-specific DNA recombinase